MGSVIGGWSASNIPDLSGQTILVTGANRGLGYATTVELAKKNCHVVMTARSVEKGEAAAAKIRALVPGATLTVMALDLGTLNAVRVFAADFKAKFPSLTALINNAGVTRSAKYALVKTADGLESTWQANFFAPFLLTNLLMGRLAAGATADRPARVVMISSVTHSDPRCRLDAADPESVNLANKDGKYYAYPVTKLADLVFSTTLHEKLEASALKGKVLSVCAHPGFSSTDMTDGLGKISNAVFGMAASQGCLSQVRAAVDPAVGSGEYVGPNTPYYGLQHLAGPLFSSTTSTPELYGCPMLGATRTAYSRRGPSHGRRPSSCRRADAVQPRLQHHFSLQHDNRCIRG